MTGLSKDQKERLSFVRHLVSEVKVFNSERYFELEEEYSKYDPTIHSILKSSRERAEKNYDDYLDKKILKLGGIHSLGFDVIENGKDLVLDKVKDKMRVQVSNDEEFRKGFLAPAISVTTIDHDRALKKALKEQQRERKLEDKSKKNRGFSFGWGR